MNLLLKYGSPKTNSHSGYCFICLHSGPGRAHSTLHVARAIGVVMLIVFAACCLAVSREGMRRD